MEGDETPELCVSDDEEKDLVDLYVWLFQVPSPCPANEDNTIENSWKRNNFKSLLFKFNKSNLPRKCWTHGDPLKFCLIKCHKSKAEKIKCV